MSKAPIKNATVHANVADAIAAVATQIPAAKAIVALPDYKSMGLRMSAPKFGGRGGRAKGNGAIAYQAEFEALIAAWRQGIASACFMITANPHGEAVSTGAKRGYVVNANKVMSDVLASIGCTFSCSVANADGSDEESAWRKGDCVVTLSPKRKVTY